MKGASQEELERRKRLQINAETVGNVASTDFPGHWPGEDHSWDLDYFRNNFHVKFYTNAPLESSFSLIGLDTSLANAFRRILLTEIPTLAIETVFISQNTSIIQDEVLAHRLGLIPLQGDRRGINWLKWYKKRGEEMKDAAERGPGTDYNTVVLSLNKTCKWQEGGLQRKVEGETDPNKLYVNHSVYAKDLVWQKQGQQSDFFAEDQPIAACNPDILIAKLRPGQEIQLTMHAHKGIGQDHAKFSPVATASYRLLPTIDILKPIVGPDAKKFARCFPKGVISLQPLPASEVDEANRHSSYQVKEGDMKAVVTDPMRDTVSRECLRHAEFKDKVKLGRVRDHFIFKVESTGQWESDALFLDAVKVLKMKCEILKRGLSELQGS